MTQMETIFSVLNNRQPIKLDLGDNVYINLVWNEKTQHYQDDVFGDWEESLIEEIAMGEAEYKMNNGMLGKAKVIKGD